LVTEPILEIAAASYVPPKPMPEPSDWVVVLSRDGVIEKLSEPMPIDAAKQNHDRVIEQTRGAVAVQMVHKAVAARPARNDRPGSMTGSPGYRPAPFAARCQEAA
jgi:hypothetical protein